LRDNVAETAAIAGSIARGGSPAEDQMLARTLVASTKDRGEQAVVVRALSAALERLCESVEIAPEPEILQLENVQHLRTTLRGRLRDERPVLDLVRILHPSPAVGGFPRERALAAMQGREAEPRGWYAGPIGWMDENGDGEFWVAIRSALLHGNEAALYAGAGIVADSDPEAELAETRLKLQPMLTALMEL
jgi:isochorismate synthase